MRRAGGPVRVIGSPIKVCRLLHPPSDRLALHCAQGSVSFVLYDEDAQYLLVHRCPGAASVPLFWGPDRATGQVHVGYVPPYSVVVSGNLPSADGKYSLYCAVIVKRVDAQTRAKTSLNDLLRD